MNVKCFKGYLYILLSALFIFAAINCSNSSDSDQPPAPVNAVDSTVKKGEESPYLIKTIAKIGIEEAQNEEEMPYQIASIRNIDCDAEGNLYLVESKTHCVKVFDQKGKFLGKMFRMGKGPNEIYRPAFGKINKFSNTLFQTIDFGYGMKQFTLDGKFLRKIYLPETILGSYDFISKNRIIFIARCPYGDTSYYNFKVLDIAKKKIVNLILPMMLSDRSDAYNSFQRFVIKGDLLWTSTTDDAYLSAFDLYNGKRVKRLIVSDKAKKNPTIDYEYKGLKYASILGYNYAHPLLLDGELFVIWTVKDIKIEKNSNIREAITCPESWKLSLYRLLNEEKLEKVSYLEGCDYMRLETTYKNRIILSSWVPYWHFKIVEVKPK